MTVEECTSFLNGRIDYERRGMPTAKELRLDRMRLLLARLDNPHLRYRVVHIAGTKGKGSTANMVAAMLHSAGHSVGMHTSPHLICLNERFWCNGALATDKELAGLADRVRPEVDAVDRELSADQPGLTFFEITTAMAFLHFAAVGVRWAVVEVGMGGRLDSTNVVAPTACVITSIGLDHTQQLGDSLAAIAAEKAGIIKPNVVVVSGVDDPAASAVIADCAHNSGCPLRKIDDDFRVANIVHGEQGMQFELATWRRRWPTVQLSLAGEHQSRNAAIAAATMDALDELGHSFDVAEAIRSLRSVRLPGRIEILPGTPTILIDSAHNEPSAQALVDAIRDLSASGSLPTGPRVLIFAVARDKRWRAMLEILTPAFDILVASTFQNNPRCLPVAEMSAADWKRPAALEMHVEPDSKAALEWSIARLAHSTFGSQPGMICVAGSIFLAAELREMARAFGAK